MAAGLGALTYALTAAGDPAAGPEVWLWGAAGLLALAAFVHVERRSQHPPVPPPLFADRQFSATNATTLFVYAALGALFVLLVLQLQVVSGSSPLLAGPRCSRSPP